MLLRLSAGLFIAATLAAAARAQAEPPLLPLPKLEACVAREHPRLPDKWQGTYLMASFSRGQLVVSDIVHDASLPATRMKLYGLRGGSLDILVAGERTYLLSTEGSRVRDCEDLGDTGWRPLPQDWLTPQSQCAGSAPVGETAADWWKTPLSRAPATYWLWSTTSDHTPFRLVFQSPNDRLAVLGQYAMSVQVAFKAVPQTGLEAVANLCRAAKRARAGIGAAALRRHLADLARSRQRADDELKRLVPAVASCPADTASSFPQWPNRVAITGLMTPFDFNENPYATEVLYDWSVPAQRSRVFFSERSPVSVQDALLLGARGYNVTYRRDRRPICAAVLPGTIRPDWPRRGSCSCEAVIDGGTPLTPKGPIKVMACTLAPPRAAWAWYTLSGEPSLFMVTSLPGDAGSALFALLDYWRWVPGHDIPPSAFKMPPRCEAIAPSAAVAGKLRGCSTCHFGPAR